MKTNEFYCVKCKKRVHCSEKQIAMKTLKNDRPCLTSNCGCGTKLFKFVKAKSVSKLAKKYKSVNKSRSRSVRRSKSKRRSRSRSKSRM